MYHDPPLLAVPGDTMRVEIESIGVLMETTGVFAVLAMLLASIGLYGVLSYFVSQRIPEFGLRMALGAKSRDILWLVLKRGPLFAGMTTYVVPVIALLWGTLDHEKISPMQLAAIAGVLTMVAIVQTGAKPSSEVLEPAAAGERATLLPLSAEFRTL